MRAHAIVNCRAGTALGVDANDIKTRIISTFREAGHGVTAECIEPADLKAALAAAAARTDIDVLIIGGGDGSVRSAADVLIGTDKILGILPLGTLNRLARDLNIPLAVDEAIHALAIGHSEAIDVASVNGRIFLCNSMFGLLPTFAVRRQALRGKPILVRLRGYAATVRSMLSATRKISIAVDDGADLQRFRALTVAITSNEYDEAPSLMLTRSRLDGGYLTLYASRHDSGWGLTWAGLRALFGRWRDDPHLVKIPGHVFTIRMPRRRVRVTNDGEVEKLEPPLRYAVNPRSLRVLRPPRDGEPRASVSHSASAESR